MSNSESSQNGTSARGFAAMDEAKQREIASKGGRAAHEQGTAHKFDSSEAREAGRKGGEAVSRNREHMAEIGRRGGEARSQNNQSSRRNRQSGNQSSHVWRRNLRHPLRSAHCG
jgi:general stress protein YciG